MKMLSYAHYNSDPFFNMAFDEWMLQKVINEKSLICLRLYSWSVGTITYGYNQQLQKAFDNSKIGETPVIKRVTGGRSLFHDESELTYSIAISSDLIANKIVSDSIAKASEEIANILIQFLDRLQISSEYVKQSSECEKKKDFFLKAPCFASFSKNEIVSDNRKIIASAQRRISGALLQHGSMKIHGFKHHDALSLSDVKTMPSNEMKKISDEAFEDYNHIFSDTFSNAFSVENSFEEPTVSEMKDIDFRINLVSEKCLEKRDFIKQSKCQVSL